MTNDILTNFKEQNTEFINKNILLEKKKLKYDGIRGKKIYLFNDTSITSHSGCLSVMNALNYELKNFIVYRHYNGDFFFDEEELDKADLIIVNGEGTIHDNVPKADFLMNILKIAKYKKKKTALINFSYFNMDDRYDKILKSINYVSARDLFTFENLKKKIDLELNFDLSISKEFIFDPEHKLNFESLIHDEIIGESVFGKIKVDKNKYNLQEIDLINASFPKSFLIEVLSHVKLHVTGRFHSVILSGLAGCSFVPWNSNTPKIQSIIKWSKIPIPVTSNPKDFEKNYNYIKKNKSLFLEFRDFLKSQKTINFNKIFNL